MWTREYIKTRAKAVLKVSYWKAFLISLLLIIIGADSQGGNVNYRARYNSNYSYHNIGILWERIDNWFPYIAVGLTAFGVFLLALMFRVLLGYPIEVGGRRFFVRSTQYEIDMGNLGYAFNSERYWDIVKTMLLKGVYNFLWYLLFIIPGIVKSYAYSMVPYILSDNPNIGAERAIELSNQMTEGQKFEMFVLDLSFIGWYLLGVLLFGIGIYFVKPYEYATKAELYLILRQNALDKGLSSYEELMLSESTAEIL